MVRSRNITPQGIIMRKVRAPQGRITDNVRRRKLPGKCNRNRLPWFSGEKVERRGKSSPARQATVCKCKPYPMQHRMQSGFSPAFARRFSAGGWRQAAMLVRDRWQSRLCRTEPGLQVSPSKRKRSPSRPFSFARRESFGVRFIAIYTSVAVRGARRASGGPIATALESGKAFQASVSACQT